jgi:hypothetical protein
VESETVYYILLLANSIILHGLSGIGTNLLCHRYLCEKARAITSLYPPPPAPPPSPMPIRPPFCYVDRGCHRVITLACFVTLQS